MIARALIAALLVAVLPGPTQANEYDGSKTLRCIATDLVSCAGPGACERTTAEQMDVPLYVTLDFGKALISGKLESGVERKTPIERVEKDEYATMIQGGEYGRAWSFVIQPDDGRFSAAIAGDAGAIVLLGSCRVE